MLQKKMDAFFQKKTVSSTSTFRGVFLGTNICFYYSQTLSGKFANFRGKVFRGVVKKVFPVSVTGDCFEEIFGENHTFCKMFPDSELETFDVLAKIFATGMSRGTF